MTDIHRFVFSIVGNHGETYQPWSDGYVIGYEVTHKDGRKNYVYLDPSEDPGDSGPTMNLYSGPLPSTATLAAQATLNFEEQP